MSRKGDRKREKRMKWAMRRVQFFKKFEEREGDTLPSAQSIRDVKSIIDFYRHKWTMEDRRKQPFEA